MNTWSSEHISESTDKIREVIMGRESTPEVYSGLLDVYKQLDSGRQLLIADAILDNSIFPQLSETERALTLDLRLPESAINTIIAETKESGANVIQAR